MRFASANGRVERGVGKQVEVMRAKRDDCFEEHAVSPKGSRAPLLA